MLGFIAKPFWVTRRGKKKEEKNLGGKKTPTSGRLVMLHNRFLVPQRILSKGISARIARVNGGNIAKNGPLVLTNGTFFFRRTSGTIRVEISPIETFIFHVTTVILEH